MTSDGSSSTPLLQPRVGDIREARGESDSARRGGLAVSRNATGLVHPTGPRGQTHHVKGTGGSSRYVGGGHPHLCLEGATPISGRDLGHPSPTRPPLQTGNRLSEVQEADAHRGGGGNPQEVAGVNPELLGRPGTPQGNCLPHQEQIDSAFQRTHPCVANVPELSNPIILFSECVLNKNRFMTFFKKEII